jgi:fluoride exporter
MPMPTWLLVAIGGAVGASLRHGVNVLFAEYVVGRDPAFPWATLVVNWLGCLLIGVLTGLVIERYGNEAAWLRPLLIVGLLGGFTTFSSFALETSNLIEKHNWLGATVYVIASNVGCIALTLLSLRFVRA